MDISCWDDTVVQKLAIGKGEESNMSPSKVRNCLISKPSRLVLKFTQSSIQWVSGAPFLGVKQPWHKANHPEQCRDQENTDLYIQSPYIFMA
jgi:hypothetical protein